jgi:hypothetical protein
MIFQLFGEYYQLSTSGEVSPLKCRNSDDHMDLVPSFDNEGENVRFLCYECGYTLNPGGELIKKMKKEIEDYYERTKTEQA